MYRSGTPLSSHSRNFQPAPLPPRSSTCARTYIEGFTYGINNKGGIS